METKGSVESSHTMMYQQSIIQKTITMHTYERIKETYHSNHPMKKYDGKYARLKTHQTSLTLKVSKAHQPYKIGLGSPANLSQTKLS